MMATTSRWATGKYEMLLQQDPEARPGDLMVTVFAKPLTMDDDADEDAPVLAQIDVLREEYDGDLMPWQIGLRDVGENALLQPEFLESIYGARLALRILLVLFEAAVQDLKGLDGEGHPWRTPSEAALPIMQRTFAVMEELKGRLGL